MSITSLSPSILGAIGLISLPLAVGQPAQDGGRGYVAVKAGTIYVVEEGRVIEDGTILVKGARIHSVGINLSVPRDAKVVDYGPDAVIVPGLFAADTSYGSANASARTAAPGLLAIDNFDFYASNASALAAGVTTAYLRPTDSRLIGGQGAVVKMAGESHQRRTLKAPATVHGAIHSSARGTAGYWDVPVPATVDVGIGYAKEQLPKSPMGAIVALKELLAAANGDGSAEDFGPHAAKALGDLINGGHPWRITAQTEAEIRAILDFAESSDIPLVLSGAAEAGYVAEEIAAAGVPVIYRLPWASDRSGADRGRGEDVRWPRYDVPARLIEAGARVAISGTSTSNLLFAAAVASQGELDPAAALRAITLTPAEIFGVADRVGSIHPGKDADFVVLSGDPITLGAAPRATWVDGELAWSYETSGARAIAEEEGRTLRPTVAIQVDELHIGDGRVLSPGQIVMSGGRITSLSEALSTPPGAIVVRGAAAMPGIVDALGHLGLEGSGKVPNLDTQMSDIVAPGDKADRRVARAGVTTVAMAPRGTGSSGTPIMAYKPAAAELEGQVLADPAAVRVQWAQANHRDSGAAVVELLSKAKAYKDKWEEYEAAMAAWTPPPPEPADEEDDDEEEDEEEEKDDDDDDKKKKKKKDKDEDEVEPDPITGIWHAEVQRPPLVEAARLRMQLKLTVEEGGGPIEGNLRCAAVTDGLIDLQGFYDAEELSVSLKGLGSQGWVLLEAEYAEAKLAGTLQVGAASIELELERTSRDFVEARRAERRKEEVDEEKAPKGKPKPPRRDGKLEPLKSALEGSTTVIVNVEREDEILECVDAFEQFGIQPVLYGASGAAAVAEKIAGRVRGVILSHVIRAHGPGTDTFSRYGFFQQHGIPIAFHSGAEEGAADLPMMAMYAIANGMSPTGALRALTSDAAEMLSIGEHVGKLKIGADADVLLLDGSPLSPGTSVQRVWVNGVEVE